MRATWTVAVAALLVLGAMSTASAAQTPSEARGQQRYVALCASCHGPDGGGGGPAATSLRVPPPDLRRIAERHGGFDRNAIAVIIDGRIMVNSHGSLDMPVWGRKGLRARKGETGPSPGMVEILDYLQSIQIKP